MKNGAFMPGDFPYVKSYLIKNQNRPLLVEGPAFASLGKRSLDISVFLSMLTPTADFQKNVIDRERMGSFCLRGTTNPRQAFENWMQQDIPCPNGSEGSGEIRAILAS